MSKETTHIRISKKTHAELTTLLGDKRYKADLMENLVTILMNAQQADADLLGAVLTNPDKLTITKKQ